MGIDILESVEEAAEKMVLTWAAQEAKMLILHVFTNQAKVASDATAAAQSATISKASKLREIFGDAKAAAAGAYKAMAGIPVVGPELGAIAAAVTFAAVMALGAFDQGGIIPGSGAVPILGHGGERVLTQSQTNTFERMVNNPGATSNTTHNHLHYNGQVNAYDRTGMRSTLRSHADDLLDIVQEGWNSGKLRRT